MTAFIKLTITDMPPSTNGLGGYSDIDLVDAYVAHGSVWKAGDALGISGQTLHKRLVAIGAANPKRVLTEREKSRIVQYYTETPSREFCLNDLASELDRTRQYISRKARELGLTDKSRASPQSVVDAVKRAKWSERPHPRGALGLKHTDETKEACSKASRKMWATAKTFSIGIMSPENRQKASDMAVLRNSLTTGENAYTRAKGGRRPDIGEMYFRSAWEANYARYLNWLKERGEIERWEYEPETFWFLAIKRGVRSYKPDFRVFEKGHSYFVEVKGWMDPRSKTKLARMKKYYPGIRVDVVGAKQYAQIKSAVSRMIPGWEA